MAKTTGDVIVEKLLAWGVDTVFGLPGDGINGIFEALRKHQDKIRFIQVRHEEAAAFAACGYAKFTGRLGVCIATCGPGAIHLLNGLYDAKMDHAPVLAITGHTYHDLIGMHLPAGGRPPRTLRGRRRLQPACHGRQARPRAGRRRLPLGPVDAERVAPHLPGGHRRSRRRRTRPRSMQMVTGHTSVGLEPADRRPAGGVRSRAAAALLNARQEDRHPRRPGRAGRRPTSSSRSPRPWRRRSSSRCWARRSSPTTPPTPPAASACWARCPPSRRWRSATRCSWSGTSFPYMQLPAQAGPGQGRADRSSTRRGIGLRYPVDVGLAGDAKATLQALLPLLERRSRTARSWRRRRSA